MEVTINWNLDQFSMISMSVLSFMSLKIDLKSSLKVSFYKES